MNAGICRLAAEGRATLPVRARPAETPPAVPIRRSATAIVLEGRAEGR